MKQFILLDWDGNLAKTLDVWLEACRIPLQKRGLDLSDAEIATCFGAPVKRFYEWGITDVDAAIGEMEQLAKQSLANVALYPDALAVLEELENRGKQMALITTSKHDFVKHLLDKYDMTHYFAIIVAGDDVTHHKPHPEPLEKAIELLGGNKEEAIMIGDSDKDIGAAKNAAIDSILFYPPEHSRFYSLETLKALSPTHIVEEFTQILEIV
jgi:HAD superfamily hydrolase (TIGR01549 family)